MPTPMPRNLSDVTYGRPVRGSSVSSRGVVRISGSGMPRIEASSNSMGWNVGRGWPCCASDALICKRQPGFAATSASGRASPGCSPPCAAQVPRPALARPGCRCPRCRSRFRLGWLEPPPGRGICAARRAAGGVIPWPWRQVAGVVIGDARGNRVAWREGRQLGQHL